MKISARNILKGKVKAITPGSVNSELTIELHGEQIVTSIITTRNPQTRSGFLSARMHISSSSQAKS
jgi:molybdopterin-binding protein